MTIDELRAEANKLGYELRKKREAVLMLNCPVCGFKRTRIWTGKNGHFRVCNFCNFHGYVSNTYAETKLYWNNAVQDYLMNTYIKGKSHDKRKDIC